MTEPVTFREVFAELDRPEGASAKTVQGAFEAILSGAWTPVQVAGFAVALRMRKETAAQIAAAAHALRGAMVSVEHDFPVVLDTCGTGGDGSGTLNLSTGAAIIAASAGVIVAKHGNRAVSSQAGSADLLEALGIPVDLPAGGALESLREAGIVFLMAPAHHPAMRHGGVARRELGIRTIFNCLGPLANPARATHHLLGAYDDELRPILARTLAELGTSRAWVVRGVDGLDEVSPYGPTRVSSLEGGEVHEFEVRPEDFGMSPSPAGAARGGNAEENARALEAILGGQPHPARDAVLLNGAAALVVALGLSPRDAFERARELVTDGAATQTLTRWRRVATRSQG